MIVHIFLLKDVLSILLYGYMIYVSLQISRIIPLTLNILVCFGNPLVDIILECPTAFIQNYNLNPNTAQVTPIQLKPSVKKSLGKLRNPSISFLKILAHQGFG